MSDGYTWWDEKVIDQFLEDVALCTTTAQALEKNGLSRTHFYRQCQKDAGLEARYREAVSRRADLIEDRAFELASETKNDKLIQFLLRAHRPDIYAITRSKEGEHIAPPLGEPG